VRISIPLSAIAGDGRANVVCLFLEDLDESLFSLAESLEFEEERDLETVWSDTFEGEGEGEGEGGGYVP